MQYDYYIFKGRDTDTHRRRKSCLKRSPPHRPIDGREIFDYRAETELHICKPKKFQQSLVRTRS